jgi:uncharacterized protein (DUF1810 family)
MSLDRFHSAQKEIYGSALNELRAGRQNEPPSKIMTVEWIPG